MLGTRRFTKIGVRPGVLRDAYHLILSMGWLGFLSILVVSYTIVNLLFATGYWLSPGAVANTPRGYLDLLFFSIETLSTVGYGTMYPLTIFGHVLASLEIFVGLLILALTTGLVFARFSRPTARIQFSDVMVVAPFNEVPTLMMRAANERHNLILEATVNMTLIYQKRTLEGETFRHQHDLALVRHRSAAFTLSWTVMHKITETSPLYGKSTKDLEDANMIIAVSIIFFYYELIPLWFFILIMCRFVLFALGMVALALRVGKPDPLSTFLGKASIFALMVLYVMEIAGLFGVPWIGNDLVVRVVEYAVALVVAVSMVDKAVFLRREFRKTGHRQERFPPASGSA